MVTWDRFLPRDRRECFAMGGPMAPTGTGAVLLADVSGFTALTESLRHEVGARRGAEEVIARVEALQNTLCAEVDRQGGSVIDFAGDAILGWFPGGASATARCVRAAMGLRDLVKRAGVSAAAEALPFKLMIAAGPGARTAVGDPSVQRLDLLLGPVLTRLYALEPWARAGAVVAHADDLRDVSGMQWQGIASAGAGVVEVLAATEDVAADRPQNIPPLPAAMALDWVPAPLRGALLGGEESFLAELRPVVALFLRVHPLIDPLDAAALTQLDARIRHVQQVLAAHDGHLLQVNPAEKGGYLYAVFGALTALEGAAGRAVDAAMALLSDTACGVRAAGAAGGTARVGLHGGSARCAYGVMGHPVNVAARLMALAADGELLADAALGLPATELLKVKGLNQPLAACRTRTGAARPAGPSRASAFTPPRRVGRDDAIAWLDAHLDGLAQGRGGVALLEAEAGLGKSLLMHEAVGRARARGLRVAESEGSARGLGAPYQAWRPVLEALLFAPAQGMAAAPWQQGLARLLPTQVALAPLLAQVMHLPCEPTKASAALQGAARAQSTRQLLIDLLLAAGRERPLLIALDDAHQADSPSGAMTQALARALVDAARAGAPAPVSLLLAGRPVDEPVLAAMRADAAVSVHSLAPLPPAATLQIACYRLGVATLSDELAAFIRDKAEGNPFYAEEVAYALQGADVLEHDGDRCRARPGTLLGRDLLPDSVEGVVATRLDRLPRDRQRLIKVASVVGRRFDASTLAALRAAAEADPHAEPAGQAMPTAAVDGALRADLDALCAGGWLEPLGANGPGAKLRFAFRHAITHDVVYQRMLFSQRRRLHRAAAQWLERSLGGVADADLPVLAGHWLRVTEDPQADAGTLLHAADCLARAATQAEQAQALGEGAAHAEDALRLLPRVPTTADRDARELRLQALLGYCLSTLRGYGDPDVERAYRRGFELAEHAPPTAHLASTRYGLFSFYASRAEYAPARRLADELGAQAAASGGPGTGAVAAQCRGIVDCLSGAAGHGLASLQASHALADTLPSQDFFGYGGDFQVFTGAWLALAHALRGEPAAARHAVGAAMARGERYPFAQGFVLAFAMAPLWERDIDTVAHWSARLAALAARHGFAMYTAVAEVYAGWAQALAGRDPAGARRIDAALPLLRAIRLRSFLPLHLGLAAEAWLRVGDRAAACAALDEACAIVGEAGASFHRPALDALRADIHP
jgi:class 3 adenylate cyclase